MNCFRSKLSKKIARAAFVFNSLNLCGIVDIASVSNISFFVPSHTCLRNLRLISSTGGRTRPPTIMVEIEQSILLTIVFEPVTHICITTELLSKSYHQFFLRQILSFLLIYCQEIYLHNCLMILLAKLKFF